MQLLKIKSSSFKAAWKFVFKTVVIATSLYVFGYILCKAYQVAGYYDDLYTKHIYVYKSYIPEKYLNFKVPRVPSIISNIEKVKNFADHTVHSKVVRKRITVASKQEMQMFAYTVEMEAHDLSFEHKQAIAAVIVNRVHHKDFNHKSIKDVLTAKKQFNGFNNFVRKKFHPNLDTIKACRQALAGDIKFSEDMVYFYNPYKTKRINFFEQKTLAFEQDGHRFFLSK